MTDLEAELSRRLAEPGTGDHDDIAPRIGDMVQHRLRARRIGAILAAVACIALMALIVWAGFRIVDDALPVDQVDKADGLLFVLPFAILAALLALATGAIATALTTVISRRPDLRRPSRQKRKSNAPVS
jgi:TRAP-type C4-dicarboxylate transport system permease small subunit